MYSRNTLAVLHFFYFQIVPEKADFRPAELCPALTAHLQDGQKGPRRSKMDRSITTQTQEFWYGRRKGKGFYASLVMLQERSQVLCKLYNLWNNGSRKESLDVSFLTVPKLCSRYFCHSLCDSVGYGECKDKFWHARFFTLFLQAFFFSPIWQEKINDKNKLHGLFWIVTKDSCLTKLNLHESSGT